MDPFTIAAGIAAVGSLFKGVTSLFAGIRQNQVEQNAALQASMEGGVAGDIALRQGDAVAAHGAVQAAANGGGFVGSSLGVIQQVASQAMFNARAATYRARTEAQNDIYQGQVAKAQGVQGLLTGIAGAGSSLVGGMAQGAQFAQSQKYLGTLRGLGADSAYDYAVPF